MKIVARFIVFGYKLDLDTLGWGENENLII